MSYTVQQLATISGVSVRTLHYYDDIGLFHPTRTASNGYRQYDEPELLKLQQILFFRELDFPLEDIKKIMQSPGFDLRRALVEHRTMIEQKKKRLLRLARTIDKTIKKINKEKNMEDEELYKAFEENEKKYGTEVAERWGNTEAYTQSRERAKNMTKEDWIRIKKEQEDLMAEIVLAYKAGKEVNSPDVQKLIEQHFEGIRVFYEPSIKMYRGLGNMYVDDPRFTTYYDKHAQGLALFMRDAIGVYCDARE